MKSASALFVSALSRRGETLILDDSFSGIGSLDAEQCVFAVRYEEAISSTARDEPVISDNNELSGISETRSYVGW